MAKDKTNIIVDTLPDYVEEKRDEIIRNVVLGGNTIKHMVPQTGIKTAAKINYIDIDPEFQDGLGCGFSAQEGGVELTQREIKTGLIKVNIPVCPDKLLGKYAEYLVKIGANENDLPFEQYIVDGIVESINSKLEKALWQGDTLSADVNLNKFDGLLKLAVNEDDTVKVTYAASDSAWDKIKKVILAIPELALQKGECVVYVSAELYRQFVLELVEKNFFHYSGPQNEAPDEIIFPGTNIMVVKTNGLNSTGVLYATFERNMYYGCDLENDKEEVKIWWSDDDDIFKIKVKWNSGVQTAFPDMVVLAVQETPGPEPEPEEVTIEGAETVSLANTADSKAETYAPSDGSAVTASVPEAATWLTATVSEGGHTVTFAAEAQDAQAEARSAEVTIATESGGSLTVTVSQAAGE